MTLSINQEDHYNYTLLELDGEIDASTSGIFKNALNRVIRDGSQHIVLECSMLTGMSSAGLKVLLLNHRNTSDSQHIFMCNVASHIASLLEISGMTRFVSLNMDVDDAETMLMESDYSAGQIYT